MAQIKTAPPASRLDADLARHLLTQMSLIRRFEEKAAEMYALGKIGGFLHLYIGQEAVAVGATSTLRPDDYAISSYREHGQCLAKGSDPRRVMAELFGRRDGLSKGKGGSMHLFDKSVNFLGGHGIVGAHLPLAAGAAFAVKYQGGDQVVLCYFGDGAVPEGDQGQIRRVEHQLDRHEDDEGIPPHQHAQHPHAEQHRGKGDVPGGGDHVTPLPRAAWRARSPRRWPPGAATR